MQQLGMLRFAVLMTMLCANKAIAQEQLRPLSADRPDATESPITVDAGRVQVEVSFLDYTMSDQGGDEFDSWTVFDANVKLGLLNNVDLQLVFGI